MSLIDFLYPKHCPVCLTALPPGKMLICEPCERKIRHVEGPTCFRCGKPLFDDTKEFCSNCEKNPPPFSEGIAWAEYTSYYTRELMAQVKYYGNRQLLDYPCIDFASRIAERVREWNAEAFIPVPVHPSRYLERGYNQAEEIAVRLSEHLHSFSSIDIPVDANLLLRSQKTTAQKTLTKEGRTMNLLGAFSCTHSSPYQTVILVDDIYTTGATAAACTRALLASGVKTVYFLALAIGHD